MCIRYPFSSSQLPAPLEDKLITSLPQTSTLNQINIISSMDLMPSGKHRFCKTLEIVFKKTKVSIQPQTG